MTSAATDEGATRVELAIATPALGPLLMLAVVQFAL